MEPIVNAFATALVAAMATDTWKQASKAVATLWRKIRPQSHAENVAAELESLRERVLAAREASRIDTESGLISIWQGRLQELLLDHPDLAVELQRILDETLTPMLSPTDRGHISQILITGIAHDSSTINQFAGGQYNDYRQYHYQLVSDPPTPIVSSLPADIVTFVGRRDEVRNIVAAAAVAAESGQVVAIHAIGGMPGVGKTALAVHVAHRLAHRFPDRQLFVDLHAHTPGKQPADPSEVLAALLAEDGADIRNLPAETERRADFWRDRLAGKRVLLILDNVANTEQVAPLLPGVGGCLVLITSRRYLGDLPATVAEVQLDVLGAGEARRMFMNMASPARREPRKAAELVAVCGYLPLAILLVARFFTKHSSWSMDQLISEVKARMPTITAENRSVAAIFGLSYEHLAFDQQRFFRYLGLHPGIDIDPYAAAALSGLPLREATERLDALLNDSLLTESAYRRFRMHDLIRAYARVLAAVDNVAEREQAVGRLIDYYQYTAQIAGRYLARYTDPAAGLAVSAAAAVPGLPGRKEAQAWMGAERPNLLACVNHAAEHGQSARVVGLVSALAAHLQSDGPWEQAITLYSMAITAADDLDDQLAKANALTELGITRRLTGDYAGAKDALGQALSIYRIHGSRLGEANSLTYLGFILYLTGDYSEAADRLEKALLMYGDLRERLGEAQALNYLGAVKDIVGDKQGALDAHEKALRVYHGLGDQLGEAQALNYLGIVRYLTGRYLTAADALERSFAIYDGLGNRLGMANVLNELGIIRYLTGDNNGAASALDQALRIYHGLGNRGGEANALHFRGVVSQLTGDYNGAMMLHEQALNLSRDLGDRLGEGNVLNDRGVVRRLIGDFAGARQDHEAALDIYRELGEMSSEAETLNNLGTLNLALAQVDQGRAQHERALDLARAAQSPLEEAHALEGMGRCAYAIGDAPAGKDALQKALKIYQEIGVAEAARLAAELSGGPVR